MSDGKTRWQHAVDMANAIVDSSGSGSEFRIADTSGQYDSPYMSDKAEAKQAIQHAAANGRNASISRI